MADLPLIYQGKNIEVYATPYGGEYPIQNFLDKHQDAFRKIYPTIQILDLQKRDLHQQRKMALGDMVLPFLLFKQAGEPEIQFRRLGDESN